ncbi:MAG: preprotein translocase subunit SecE [Clostridia bacterium]|nr:preprotein translocase subunit SecE [Clostridia bacterium]
MSGMNFKKTLLVLLLTLTLLFTLAVPTFAEEVTTEAEITSGEANSEEVTTEASGDVTTEAGTTATTTDGATTTKGSSTTTSSSTTAAGDEGWGVGDWVSLAIGVVIIAVLLVLAILFITVKDDGSAGKDGGKVPFRIRGKRFFRSTKSEASKVVWTPWKTVRKNTLVVIIVMIACALLIGLLDWVLSEGIVALAGLF